MTTAISIEDLSKYYRLGVISGRTFREDMSRWVARRFGQQDSDQAVATRRKKKEPEHIWALRDINLTIAKGDVVGIIGRNGAGKSTLLKILSRITTPSSGVAKVNGRIASLLEVGTGFHPELTGRENVFLNGAILGMRRAEIQHKMDEIVDFSGVEKFIDTPVKRYSSGMRVRLAFAVGAHLDPEILVVDEVLAVGDVAFQKKCIGKMNDISTTGRTVLFVSHNLGMVKQLCKRGVCLEGGRVIADTSVNEAIETYISTSRKALDEGTATSFVHFEKLKLEMISVEDVKLNYATIGENIQFTITYCSAYSEDIHEGNFRIIIKKLDGTRMFICESQSILDGLQTFPQEGRVVCTIPQLSLQVGTYWAGLEVRTIKHGWMYQNAEMMQFDVVLGDYYGTGHVPDPYYGVVLVNHQWQIQSA
ncbi:MAG: polysaccharide ABC transporter ATP-binding protein [Candidatus Promineifilaceae bacterium]